MARSPKTVPPVDAAVETVGAPVETVGAYTIEDGIPIPEIVRLVGQRSEYPLGRLGVNQSIFIPAVIADTITDPAERVKATKEEQRKLSNRVTGIARRFARANEGYEFTARSVTEAAGAGVRLWRVASAPAPAPVAPPLPPAAPAFVAG